MLGRLAAARPRGPAPPPTVVEEVCDAKKLRPRRAPARCAGALRARFAASFHVFSVGRCAAALRARRCTPDSASFHVFSVGPLRARRCAPGFGAPGPVTKVTGRKFLLLPVGRRSWSRMLETSEPEHQQSEGKDCIAQLTPVMVAAGCRRGMLPHPQILLHLRPPTLPLASELACTSVAGVAPPIVEEQSLPRASGWRERVEEAADEAFA